jgi:hypothetical protein
MRRVPLYLIIAICGLLSMSAGVAIILADGETPAPVEPTVEAPPVQPTVEVPPVQPTVEVIVPTVEIIPPTIEYIPPTVEVIPPTVEVIVPTVEVIVPTVEVIVPTIEVIQPTVEVIVPTVDSAVIQPTQPAPVTPQTVITGQVTFYPQKTDYSGIVVTLTLPNGMAVQTQTDTSGVFTFVGMPPGGYQLMAGVSGFLPSQLAFSLIEGQNLLLPPTILVAGDTNLDNIVDLSDAVLIAANFNGPASVPQADLNGDGWVDIRDLAVIGAYYGRSGPVNWQ